MYMYKQARPKLRPELNVVLKETRGVQNSGVTRANVGREVRTDDDGWLWYAVDRSVSDSCILTNQFTHRIDPSPQVEMLKAARGCAFVSQFYAAFIEGDSHYMVMEFVPGGDLLKTVQQCMAAKVGSRYLIFYPALFRTLPLIYHHTRPSTRAQTPPDEPTLWRYLYELGQGVAFLHRRGIVHRDIKCQNIMLSSQGHIKLIDLVRCCCVGWVSINNRVGGGVTLAPPSPPSQPSLTNPDRNHDNRASPRPSPRGSA